MDIQLSRARDLDLKSGHTAYHRASLINLYLHTKFHWNRRNVLWMDRRMHGRTDIWDTIRSTQKRWPKMWDQKTDKMENTKLT